MITNLIKVISKYIIPPTIESPLTKDLSHIVAIVTGASKGVGLATAEQLLKDGASVVVVSRNKKDLQRIFDKYDARVLFIEGDVTNETDVKKIVDHTVKTFKKIDVLVNNVGRFMDKPLEESNNKEFDAMMFANIKGMFLMTKTVLPHMKRRKNGTIINIGSKISHNTNVSPNKVLYATGKYAVEGFSFALNKELKSYGIRVTCLMPGTIGNFVSLKSKTFMSASYVALLVSMILKMDFIDFESIVFKSKYQNI